MKSKNITKFHPDWQFLRVQVKGPSVSIEDKLRRVGEFYVQNPTIDNRERILNWLQGLLRGMKCFHKDGVHLVHGEISHFEAMHPTEKEEPLTHVEMYKKMDVGRTAAERLQLWIDLYDRTKGWGSYLNKDQDLFMRILSAVFIDNEEAFPKNKSMDDYLKMVSNPGTGGWKGVY